MVVGKQVLVKFFQPFRTVIVGTYLVWVDCSALKQSSENIVKTLLEKEKLWVNEGNLYGEAGEGFVRINIACPRQRLIEGLNRMRRALSSPITSFT